MRSARPDRRVVWLALVALFLATTAFTAHAFADKGLQHEVTACDLCLQFSGSAGPPDAPVVGKPPLLIFDAVAARVLVLPTRRVSGNRLARAPPFTDLI